MADSFPQYFEEITGISRAEMFRSNMPSLDTDRGIMMLALRCLSQGVVLTEEERTRLREAYNRREPEMYPTAPVNEFFGMIERLLAYLDEGKRPGRIRTLVREAMDRIRGAK